MLRFLRTFQEVSENSKSDITETAHPVSDCSFNTNTFLLWSFKINIDNFNLPDEFQNFDF